MVSVRVVAIGRFLYIPTASDIMKNLLNHVIIWFTLKASVGTKLFPLYNVFVLRISFFYNSTVGRSCQKEILL